MVSLPFDIDSLAALRQIVAEYAVRVGLTEDRVCDLQLAVNELATNTVTHADGPGVLRLWAQSDRLICEISDAGRLTDPLAGRIPPPDDSEHGRGLILINHVCDLVQTYVGSHGTTIRVHAVR
jgi:anti-sigma regulatory factor (Ser/Thr protein kinase)